MKKVETWFRSQNWKAQPFQKQCWKAYAEGKSGMLHAPTGSGKTYALWGGVVEEMLQSTKPTKGLHALWITPLRALGVEIQKSTQEMLRAFAPELGVGLRTADTPQSQRTKMLKSPPFGLVSTPESVHVLLAQKEHPRYFSQLKVVVVDEWHELLGSKRGVQVELALAYLRALQPNLKVWGISATLGNKELAREILLKGTKKFSVVEAKIQKKFVYILCYPKPWSVFLGVVIWAYSYSHKYFKLSKKTKALWSLPIPDLNVKYGTISFWRQLPNLLDPLPCITGVSIKKFAFG